MDALWLALAFSLGFAASSVGLPPLVGYLATGFLLHALGHTGGELLHQLAHTGVLLLLFTVGLKLRWRSLLRAEVYAPGLLQLTLVSATLTLTLTAFGLTWYPAAFLAVGLAFSSTVLAVKLLEEKRELRAYHGRVAVGVLVLQDLVAVGMMTLAGTLAPSPFALLLLGLPLLTPILRLLVVRSGHAELLLLFGLVLALTAAQLFEATGLSGELGALAIGTLLAGHPRSQELSNHLWGLKEAFLVAFFLEIGLAGWPQAPQLFVTALLLLFLPLKAGALFLLFVRFRLRARTAFLTSLALASYSEFALIVGQVGVSEGLVPATWLTPLALSVALSFALAAPLNRAAHALYERFEPFLLRFERSTNHPDREPFSLGRAHFLVIGMGRTGTAAYGQLHEAGERVVGLDSDPGKVETHIQVGRRVLYGDAEDPDLWQGLDLNPLRAVILTAPDLEARLRASLYLRRQGYRGVIGAISHFPEEEVHLHEAGVTLVLYPFTEAGASLATLVRKASRSP